MSNNPYLPFPARVTRLTRESDLEFSVIVAVPGSRPAAVAGVGAGSEVIDGSGVGAAPDVCADSGVVADSSVCTAAVAEVPACGALTPGQFFQVSLPRIGEAPISISAFGSDWIQFTIRAVGRLTNVLQHLQVGDNLFLRGPYGNGFPLEKFVSQRLCIVAGGSGIAPVRPLIEQYIAGALPVKSLDLIVGFKNSGCLIFSDHLREWSQQARVTLTIDQPEPDWTGKVGLVTSYVRHLQLAPFDDLQVVVVGPPLMMKFTVAEFKLAGVPDQRIWVSFERLMSCGIGKCGHCKIDDTYVCVDGPVFNFSHAARLID